MSKYKKDDILINRIFESESISTINLLIVREVKDDKYICKSQLLGNKYAKHRNTYS